MSSGALDDSPEGIYVKKESDCDYEIAEVVFSDNENPDSPGPYNVTNYHDSSLPLLQDFPGLANFQYRLPRVDSSMVKPTWEYSELLNHVFIKMDRVLIVQFSFDEDKIDDDLYIRGVLIYSSADHVFTAVNRCAVHTTEDDPSKKSHAERNNCMCLQYGLAGHVLRTRTVGALYCYDPSSERHSVMCSVKHTRDISYSFSCTNSCAKGIQRRTTKLVFTLENRHGEIFGRASVDVKICSCPRRDKEIAEKSFFKQQGFDGRAQTKVRQIASVLPSSSIDNTPEVPETLQSITAAIDCDLGDETVESLPGEVIMKIRSEVRNIRQALQVIDRRCGQIRSLLEDNT